MIRAQNISKSYNHISAIEDINFEVKENELFGFIGPDGAGKTSLFRIMASLLLPDSGQMKLCGLDAVKDYKKLRTILGYMPGRFSLYQDLSVEENLNFFATIFGTTVDENYDLIKSIYSHIEPFKKRPAGKLSGGMKQKLALSCALVHKPRILLLDEPTTGVDAVSRKEFWQMLKELQHKGITIVVSTPYMDEAELCDRVALIQKGKIMAIDSPSSIANNFNQILWQIKAENLYPLKNELNHLEECTSAFLFGHSIHATFDPIVDPEQIKQKLIQKGHFQLEMKPIPPGIEDCFMHLMNQ